MDSWENSLEVKKKFIKIHQKFQFEIDSQSESLGFPGISKKTTKSIKNHQNASNLLLNFLYKKNKVFKKHHFFYRSPKIQELHFGNRFRVEIFDGF